jgi:hypothetical protein
LNLKNSKAGMVVHACNPSTWEAEAGGSQVQNQSISKEKKRKKW